MQGNFKKLMLAVGICLTASFYTFFQTNLKTSKLKEKKAIPSKTLKKEVEVLTSEISKVKNQSTDILVHKKTNLEASGDPYQDLLQRIDSQEFDIPEEQKQESLRQYLDSTVSANALETPEQIIQDNYIPSQNTGREE